ncbi:MAG TPA: histidinol-phosphate transaminase [Enteractinococcus helveticum]|uniref:Histidinol-phosphate aminotransferase n=1 Tax=Enteractinococcus helveticum TaxID=1837282 RepID=A0A921FPH3_9MICC|nr:histidinol-phosphate transaminase [Enteractinococcus helveticum]HJF15873.1 histidinol-phosphate transaminase [Enteractinococcus helveticum]
MTQQTVASFFRPAVDAVPNYKPGKQPAVAPGMTAYKLSSNEHYLPPLPAVVKALTKPMTPSSYPDPAASALTAELAMYLGVGSEHITVGAGGSEMLSALAHVTLEAGCEVVYPSPSFELYEQVTALTGAVQRPIPLTPDYRHDLPAMAEAITDHTRLVLLCSPNNPTGPAITAHEFESFMAAVPPNVLVALDEAYWEFMTNPDAVNGLDMVNNYPNLVLIRTFSKAHGLAGFRIGYAVGQPEIISAIGKAQIPFGVTQPSQNAAIASLHHIDQVLERARAIAVARDKFVTALRAQGWQVPEAQANFVWLPLGELSTEFENACVAQALAVRNLGHGVRISIGEPAAMQRILEVTAKFITRHSTICTKP